MSKYDQLWKYLQNDERNALKLAFEEIKVIVGFDIDHSFLKYKREAGQFGYQVGRISMRGKHITFNKLEAVMENKKNRVVRKLQFLNNFLIKVAFF